MKPEYCKACYDGLRPADGSTCPDCNGTGLVCCSCGEAGVTCPSCKGETVLSDTLTPGQAAELYQQLSGQPIKRQRIQQLAERGDIASEIVERTIRERRIPRAEIERLVREGLPDRGKGGRPRKEQP